MVIALGGAFITGAAALLVGIVRGHQERAQRAEERTERTRDLGSRALASALTIISDASPDGLTINTRPEMLDHLGEVWDEWRTVVRPALMEFAVLTSSPEASKAARELAAEIPKGINMTSMMVAGILQRIENQGSMFPHADQYTPAKAKNDALLVLAGDLEKALSS